MLKAAQFFPTLIINQQFRMISVGLCDTEDWSNDCNNVSQNYSFFFFYQIDTAKMSVKNFFKKNIKKSY